MKAIIDGDPTVCSHPADRSALFVDFKRIAILLATCIPVSTSAKDCVPGFYRSLPRDRDWHYAAGSGDSIAVARDTAVAGLVAKVASVSQHDNVPPEILVGWEQDDYAACDGTHFVMVRIEKKVAARLIAEYYTTRQNKVDKLEPRLAVVEKSSERARADVDSHAEKLISQDLSLQRLHARIESVKTASSVEGEEPEKPAPYFSPRAEAGIQKELMPMFKASMSRLDSGGNSVEDMGVVAATYTTLGQESKLRTFCKRMLKRGDSLKTNELLWLTNRCREASGVTETERKAKAGARP